jgi:hypothetical protein
LALLQVSPVVQSGQLPPQSSSDSLPFSTLSVHEGSAQLSPVHTPSTQSFPVLQPSPWVQFAVQLPPQSTSVSVPFMMLSVQLLAAHVLPPGQLLLWQSLAAPQSSPVPQRGQAVAPPQSTSVSPPFRTPSSQATAWQTPFSQLLLWQLPSDDPQALPSAQRRVGAHEPPQSTSVSLPFRTPSVQLAPAHEPPEQLPLTQSLLPLQVSPVPQSLQLPPQSMSLSV